MSKAPDKIYVTIPSRLKGDSPNYVGIAFKNRDHLTTPQIEEYIRKDALLDLLKGFDTPVTHLAYQELIDKINSL